MGTSEQQSDDRAAIARRILVREEGVRAKAYIDTRGHPTVGVGHKIGASLGDRLLQDLETRHGAVPEWAVRSTLNADIEGARRGLIRFLGRDIPADAVTPLRLAVLTSMVFQLGERGVGRFRRMRAAVIDGDWDRAADEALDSDWARADSPARARRHADILRRDTAADCWPTEYPENEWT